MPTAPLIVQQCNDTLCEILTNPKLIASTSVDLPDDVFATALILSLLTTDNKQTQAAIGDALIAIAPAPAAGQGGQGQGGTNVNTASTGGSTGVRTASQTPGAPPPPPPPPPLRPVSGPDGERFSSIPPITENRFIQNEVVLQMGNNIPLADVQRIAQGMGLSIISQQNLDALGRNAFRFSIGNGRSVRDVIRALEANSIVAVAQPNYQYRVSQNSNTPVAEHKGDPAQYMVEKLQLEEVHRIASGKNVTIAVIDSEADKQHTELQGQIAEQFNAVGEAEKAHSHGTAMVGAIASRDRLLGVAPGAKILAVRAFSESQQSAEGTTFNILKSIDWAVSRGAKVINMSFAGPRDPALERTLKKAYDQGVVLIAAAGNAGPKSPPLYPGADPSVIAVTATDAVTVGDHSAVITGITTRVAVATPVGESAGDVAPPGVAVPVGTTVVARLIDVATATLGSGVGDATTGVAGSVVASGARPGVAVMPDAPTGAVGATIDATPSHANTTPTTMCKARQRARPPADAGATPGGHEWLPVAPRRAGTPPAGERFRSPVIGGASTGTERHGDAAVPGGPEARREASRRTSA